MSLQRAVLVLNATYEAANIIQARRAIAMVMRGKAVVEELSGESIRTSRMSIPIPSVIRLLVYRKVPRQTRSVSRKNILLRDNHTCQYCGIPFEAKRLTIDHVIPKSKGGRNEWSNLVAACKPCNNRKASKSPEEAGMPLPRRPIPITIHAKTRMLAPDKSWDKYLFV